MKYSPPLSPAFDTALADRLAYAAAVEVETASLFPHDLEEGRCAGLVLATNMAGGIPVSSIRTGGLPIVSRQIRQLHALGVTRIILAMATDQGDVLAQAKREADRCGLALEVADSAEALVASSASARIFAIDEGLLVDERMLTAFFTAEPAANGMHVVIATQGAANEIPVGLANLPAGALDQTAAARLLERGLGALGGKNVRRRDLSALDDYAPERRRRAPMIWLRLRSAADGRKGTSLLLASSQKGCLDWPARFIHPPIENLLTRLFLPTPVTPNQISVFVFALGLFAAWCFATGAWPLALGLMLVIGPLDGLDGKLARTRLDFSPYGDLEHVGDKIVEYACYICMAAWLGTGWAWAACALIVLFALAEAVQGEFFRRLTGGQLDDAGKIERQFRIISGRRNTFMWCLIPFALLGAWGAGFVMIAAYSVVTFFFAQWRFFVRLGEAARRTSPELAENLRRTAYAFLDKTK